ncbi:hypothetical protein BDZ90DRAFT_15069 [Jaminaea rosea]|uniref:Uncharacterized protein n=1 Tax=Jaminaea rosea TaxID=1569628 RepID=A0A316UZ33_9BASI|nr:hypothetical protein BDZ90DRAFT_15069 [Jaminaea rosea]PWN30472.1 hypothetical protein BDZ90DRAFT_15069 [Jaminaea rosea]
MATVASSTTAAVPSTSKHTLDDDQGPVPLFTHTSQYQHYLFPTSSSSSSLRIALTAADEDAGINSASALLLQQYYLLRLPLLSKAFGLSEKVLATSMTYFKRFWLQRGVAEPLDGSGSGGGNKLRAAKGVKVVMLICLYLATKTHSTPISLAAFAMRISGAVGGSGSEEAAAAIKETEQSIRDYEFEVATVLSWRFRVTHAFEAARGMALDLQCPDEGRDGAPPLQAEMLKKLLGPLNAASHSLRLTDGEFRYTPSQLAFGTWWSLTKREGNEALDEGERALLRALLQGWVKAKEEAAAAAEAKRANAPIPDVGKMKKARGTANGDNSNGGGTPSTRRPLSSTTLLQEADEIASLVSQGSELEARLKGKETLDEVKAIDARLKEWAAGKEKQEVEEGAIATASTAKRKAGEGASAEGEAGATKRAKVRGEGAVDSDDDE